MKTLKDVVNQPFLYKAGFSIRTYKNKDAAVANVQFDICVNPDVENDNEYYELVKKFVVDALNNEWERVYGEPKRWVIINNSWGWDIECPRCNTSREFDTEPDWDNHCPQCKRHTVQNQSAAGYHEQPCIRDWL